MFELNISSVVLFSIYIAIYVWIYWSDWFNHKVIIEVGHLKIAVLDQKCLSKFTCLEVREVFFQIQ